nr:MAG TPA: hypothetical protein [Caudoviricetes sp.]
MIYATIRITTITYPKAAIKRFKQINSCQTQSDETI